MKGSDGRWKYQCGGMVGCWCYYISLTAHPKIIYSSDSTAICQ